MGKSSIPEDQMTAEPDDDNIVAAMDTSHAMVEKAFQMARFQVN